MDRDSPEVKQTAGTPRKPAAPLQERRVASRELLGARGVLIIEHDGREYRLRVTQNRKLILTA
jgi:hemin uptake protein HemP